MTVVFLSVSELPLKTISVPKNPLNPERATMFTELTHSKSLLEVGLLTPLTQWEL